MTYSLITDSICLIQAQIRLSRVKLILLYEITLIRVFVFNLNKILLIKLKFGSHKRIQYKVAQYVIE